MSGNLLLAVGYLRRSTDQQDQSIGDQRAAIESFAARNSLQVINFYVDDAISGTRSYGRNAFQQMIEDGCAEPRRFGTVLVYDVKRFGRMDNDETGYYRYLLRMHGVQVCYVSEGFTNAFIDDLVRPVKQWQARQESKDLAKVVIRGYLSKFHSRGGGWWMSGVPPFGYDRRYQDSSGQFLFIVRNMRDGTKQIRDARGHVIRVLAGRERLNISSQDRCRLTPSEPERVLLVQRIFHECVENGLGCESIAKRLNADGILTPRNSAWDPHDLGECWKYATIREVLCNRAYVGDVVWNRRTAATFYSIHDSRAVERLPHEVGTRRVNDPEHWFVARDAHPPLVSRAVFELVQEARKQCHHASRRNPIDPHRDESDYRAQFVLTGLLQCACCGHPLRGGIRGRKYHCRRQRHYCARVYVCFRTRKRVGCRLSAIRKRVLERIVTKRIIAWYERFRADDGEQTLRQAAMEQCRRFRNSAGLSAKGNHVVGAEKILQSALRFLRDLPSQLRNHDIKVRRVAFRRCVRNIRVDVRRRCIEIWLRRLPVLGATAGGVVRVLATLPAEQAQFTLGPRKRKAAIVWIG